MKGARGLVAEAIAALPPDTGGFAIGEHVHVTGWPEATVAGFYRNRVIVALESELFTHIEFLGIEAHMLRRLAANPEGVTA